MRTVTEDSSVRVSAAGSFAGGSSAVSGAGILPCSVTVGRIIRRLRVAEEARRDLEREAERLMKLGRVMQQD